MGERLRMDGETPPEPGKGTFFLLALFVAGIHGVWWLTGDGVAQGGGFTDGDSYTWLIRVERLLETGAWFDNSLPRFNAPFGMTIHWTRPLDVLLIGLSLPLVPALGWGKALYGAGVAISPLLHVLTALALAWAAAPVLGRWGAVIAGALTATESGVLAFAMAGRADHHMLFALIAVLALGALIRALAGPGENDGNGSEPGDKNGGKHATMAGLLLALGIWVGPEMLLLAGLGMAVAGLKWVACEDGSRRLNVRLAAGLALGLAAAMVLERGAEGFFGVEYDRISVVQLTPMVLIWGFWWAVSTFQRRGLLDVPARRLGAGISGAVLVIGISLILFPRIPEGPMAGADPEWFAIWARISESGSIDDVPHFLLYAGSVVFAGPWAVWWMVRAWPGKDRWPWFLIMAATLVFTVAGVLWLRWVLYAGLFLAIIVAGLILDADRALDKRFVFPTRVVVKVGVILVLAIGPLAAGAGAVYGMNGAGREKSAGACPVRDLARFLDRPPWNDRSRVIVASGNFGPELVYRTRHRAVASVYHRNDKGMLAGRAILAGRDEGAVRDLIRERRVDLVLLCPGSSHDGYFLENGGESLYRRLERGDLPGWISEIALTAGLKGRFRLFQVSPPVN